MPQAVKSNLFLYADDSCLIFLGKDVIEIEKQLNIDFTNICEWFVDNRLSIHFGEDKTKFILFASKREIFPINECETLINWLPVKDIQSIHKFICFQILY